MKTILLLSGALLLAAGCGTTQTDKQARTRSSPPPQGVYEGSRVEGQWAREAGMHEKDWFVKHVPGMPAAETATAQPAPDTGVAQGGTPAIGQAIATTTGTAGLEIADQAEIDLRKEEMVIGKREVSNGGVLIRTIVQTENVSQPIELKREEYVIERVPAGSAHDQQARAENAFQGREVYIPLMREEALSGKKTLLTEAVKIGKRVETDRQTVTMPVRSEDIQIVKNPDLTDPKFSSVPRRSPAGLAIPAGTPATAQSGTLKLAREELVVGKQEVDSGGVYLQKIIRTESASQPVELTREEYEIQRTPITGEVAADFSQRQIGLDLKRQEAVAGTRNYVAETVRVRKQLQTDQQLVTGTVRKESVEVVRLADQAMGGTGIAGQSGVTLITESSAAPSMMTKDQILVDHVRTTLARPGSENFQAMSNIEVTSQDGIVTLKGKVASEKEKKDIGKQVKKLSGVRSVNNELEIATP